MVKTEKSSCTATTLFVIFFVVILIVGSFSVICMTNPKLVDQIRKLNGNSRTTKTNQITSLQQRLVDCNDASVKKVNDLNLKLKQQQVEIDAREKQAAFLETQLVKKTKLDTILTNSLLVGKTPEQQKVELNYLKKVDAQLKTGEQSDTLHSSSASYLNYTGTPIGLCITNSGPPAPTTIVVEEPTGLPYSDEYESGRSFWMSKLTNVKGFPYYSERSGALYIKENEAAVAEAQQQSLWPMKAAQEENVTDSIPEKKIPTKKCYMYKNEDGVLKTLDGKVVHVSKDNKMDFKYKEGNGDSMVVHYSGPVLFEKGFNLTVEEDKSDK